MDILQFAQQRVLEQQGRSVVRCLLHATKIAPDSPHAWQLLAHVHMNEMGRPAEAVKYLRGAIKAAPATVDYWLALAQARAHTPHTMHAHTDHTSRPMAHGSRSGQRDVGAVRGGGGGVRRVLPGHGQGALSARTHMRIRTWHTHTWSRRHRHDRVTTAAQ